MEKSKAVLISSIVLFAIGIALFIVAFAAKFDSSLLVSYVGAVFVILAIIAAYVGTILKVNENKKKV